MHNHDQHECLFPQEEFRLHFKNISKIIDCVGCFKCRLWGKLQVRFVSSVWEHLVLGLVWMWPLDTHQLLDTAQGCWIPYLCRQQEAADPSLLGLEETGITQERGRGCRAWVK